MSTYKRYYNIFYSINGEPHVYKFNNFKSFSSMCKQMNKKNNFDYVKPILNIEWNSLQDLYSGTTYGSIIPDGQQPKENIQTIETVNKHVKNSKQQTLNF